MTRLSTQYVSEIFHDLELVRRSTVLFPKGEGGISFATSFNQPPPNRSRTKSTRTTSVHLNPSPEVYSCSSHRSTIDYSASPPMNTSCASGVSPIDGMSALFFSWKRTDSHVPERVRIRLKIPPSHGVIEEWNAFIRMMCARLLIAVVSSWGHNL